MWDLRQSSNLKILLHICDTYDGDYLSTTLHISFQVKIPFHILVFVNPKGNRMGRSDKVSLGCVSLLINTRLVCIIINQH